MRKSSTYSLQFFIKLFFQDVCRYLIRQSLSIGIEVVREDMDPVEYRKFLEERQKIVEEQLQFHAEKKATKMLRAA